MKPIEMKNENQIELIDAIVKREVIMILESLADIADERAAAGNTAYIFAWRLIKDKVKTIEKASKKIVRNKKKKLIQDYEYENLLPV